MPSSFKAHRALRGVKSQGAFQAPLPELRAYGFGFRAYTAFRGCKALFACPSSASSSRASRLGRNNREQLAVGSDAANLWCEVLCRHENSLLGLVLDAQTRRSAVAFGGTALRCLCLNIGLHQVRNNILEDCQALIGWRAKQKPE